MKQYENGQMLEFIQGQLHAAGTMSAEEFLEQLNAITLGSSVIVGTQALKIYDLRTRYEGISKQGPYREGTIRSQSKSGIIKRLSPQEVEAAFGAPMQRPAYYWLNDALRAPLGRWYHEEITRKKHPRKHYDVKGRPPTGAKGRVKTGKPVGRPRRTPATV